MADVAQQMRNLGDAAQFLAEWAERVQAVQKLIGRLAFSADQRRLVTESLGHLLLPSGQLDALAEAVRAMSPPVQLLQQVQAELAEQREALDRYRKDLRSLERTVERYALAAEQIAAVQQPVLDALSRFAAVLRGDEPAGESGAGEPAEGSR